MSKEDKQRILATNRLLEILRAERGSDDVASSEEALVDSDLLIEDEEDVLQYASAPDSDQISETTQKDMDDSDLLMEDEEDVLQYGTAPDSDQVSETTQKGASLLFTDENEEIEQESIQGVDKDTVSESDIPIEKDDQLYEDEPQSDESPSKTEVDPEVAKLAASLTTSETESDSTLYHSEDLKDDLLLKTEIPKDIDESGSTDIILPPEFNDNLITFYEETIEKPSFKNRLQYLKRYFSDNKRKITVYIDSNTIYLLQTLSTLQETEVEMVKSYSLPYEYGNQMITGISDLLTHIFENEIDPKDKKLSFGAYISMNTPSKTIIIKSPKLKKKEFKELVEWNANKNLPFSTENKSVNWKIAKSRHEGDAQEVIIGVTETDSVNSIDSIFKRNNINLRFTSTLSISLFPIQL